MHYLTGPMAQLAWVVDDIAAAEGDFGSRHQIGRWTRLDDVRFGPDECTLRGAPADFTAHISMSYVGDLQLELIQPVTGDSLYAEFLAEHGPGLHHACWYVVDLAAALEAAGTPDLVAAGAMAGGEVRFAYLEPGLSGIPFLELAQLGPSMLAFYADIKAASGAPYSKVSPQPRRAGPATPRPCTATSRSWCCGPPARCTS